MTVALEVRIGDLLPEFFANTLIILCPFQAAGAITTGAFQAVPHDLYHFLILIESECSHHFTSLPPYCNTLVKTAK